MIRVTKTLSRSNPPFLPSAWRSPSAEGFQEGSVKPSGSSLASGFSSVVTSPCCRRPSGPSGTLERPCRGLSGLWPSYRLWRWYGAGEELLVGRLTSCTLALSRLPHIYAGKISSHNSNQKHFKGVFFFPLFTLKKVILELSSFL